MGLFPAVSRAQNSASMNVIIQAYEKGYFQDVITLARQSLEDTAGFQPDDIIYLRTYLAFSLVAMGQDDEAVKCFNKILIAKPKMELNPEFVSPKIIEVFKRAQIEYFRTTSPSNWNSSLMFEKGRPGKIQALWRSALLPGWGQSIRGDFKKGRTLKWGSMGMAAVTGLVFLGTYINHQNYLDATESDRIQAKYKIYDRWYRARYFTVNLAVSFWSYNLIDIIISE
jgi:hypothetical protein